MIYLKDDVRKTWVQRAAFGPKNIDYRSIHEPIELPFGSGIVGRVGKSGIAEVIADTSTDLDYVVDDAIRGSEMAVPILCDGEVIGVIDSEHSLQGFFQPSHLRIMQNIANICGQKIGRSIGEQKITEFAKFFELNPNPVARLSTSGEVLLSNKAAKRAFGQEFESGHQLKTQHPIRVALEQALEQAGSFHAKLELWNSWYQVSISRVHGKPFVNLYAVDVTDMQKARSRATEAERHKSEFLSVMSHEIRTPLNAILGLIELMREEQVSEKDRQAHLSYMEFAGRHLHGLLTDVLDLERLGSGNAEPHFTPFEPRELLARVMKGFENRARATKNELVQDIGNNVPQVLIGDVGWITQMMNNLVANALKFTNDGRVASCMRWERSQLVLVVEDTGGGIPEEELQRILEPFEQLRKDEINVSNDGVGLGLAITKRLIELHKGTFKVESTLGEGSTFTIELPLHVGVMNQPDDPSVEVEGKKARNVIPDEPVLIVDDNNLNILVAKRMISNWGYDVMTASNADEAEACMKEKRPFLVLLDIHMPGRDGFQAASDWKLESCEWRDIPLVGLTADAETHTRENALISGMDDVVVKPFNPPHLRSIVEHHAMQSTK